MKKIIIVVVLSLLLIPCLGANYTPADSSPSHSIQTFESSIQQEATGHALPFHLDLATIDWTAISSILTFGAIAASLYSNRLSRQTLKVTVAIQEQNKALAWMKKRVEIIQAVKAGQDTKLDDISYYFGLDIRPQYQDYVKKQRLFLNIKHKYESFFDKVGFTSVSKDYTPQERQELDQDLPIFRQLANEYEEFGVEMTAQSKQKFAELNRKYYITDQDSPDEPVICLRYIDVSLQYDQIKNEFDKSKQRLIDQLENILYQSLELHV